MIYLPLYNNQHLHLQHQRAQMDPYGVNQLVKRLRKPKKLKRNEITYMGYPAPNFIAVSISLGVASPNRYCRRNNLVELFM